MFYKTFRTSYRGAQFFLHLIIALLICTVLPIILKRDWFRKKTGSAITQWWSKRATNILGLSIVQQGKPFESTSLIVSNHISFLDIIVIASTSPVIFLAKSTLRSWPVIGFIADRIGTIFIQRNNKRTVLTVKKSITTALEQKQSLVLFPEGTTTVGKTVNKFHSGLFQAAINAKKPVQPVALHYKRNGKVDNTAAYVDDDNFIIILIKIMAQTKTEVQITFCDLIDSKNFNRVELASTSHNIISQTVGINT